MKLRYIVEDKFSKTFTASKDVEAKKDADKKVFALLAINMASGYMKYSGFILYDDQNNVIYKYKS